MLNYILRKLLAFVPMLLLISLLIYTGIELMPGDVTDFIIPMEEKARMTTEQLDSMRAALGIDGPFFTRYLKWLGRLAQGDFGYSLTNSVPVREMLAATLPATLELSIAALLISTVLGSILGLISALKKGSLCDQALTVAGMVGVAIPQFLFGLICIVLFVFQLGWLPVGGRITTGIDSLFDRMKHLLLPAVVLGISMTAGVMRYTRASMLDSLSKDFILTARSKGIPEWRINLIHGLRVAYTPVIVLIGFRLPMLIGGSIVIEQVFQWPGVGKMFITAVQGQNTPIVMAVAFFSVLVVLCASILVDVLTAVIDPRVKLS